MKDSHLRTPRQIRDCSFTMGYYAAQPYKHEESHSKADRLIAVLAMVALLVVILV